MVVWGGYNGGAYVLGGGRYDPVADSWRPISTTGQPSGRYFHSTVWSGSEMIVWAGNFNTSDGGAYNPRTNVCAR